MTDRSSLSIPATSRFGWPKPARIEEFKKLLAAPTSATFRIVFQGKTIDIPIIRVPINLPKYRMANGRTASLQAEFLARNPTEKIDLFSGDAELWASQEVQHGLLLQVAKQSDLRKYFEDTAVKQVEPILLDENGFVVNGNRRLSTWRDLCHLDNSKYGHFRHIDVAVLPHCDEKEIDRLEATLQIAKDIKADYSWDAEANMMLAKQKRDGFSNKELAELYDMKEGEVQELMDMRAYADEYLRSRNKANLWSNVSEHEFAFKKIAASRPRISGIGSQEVFKQAAFTLIDNPDEAGGRLYDAIPAIVESLDIIKEKLQAEFDVKPEVAPADLDDMFGGTPTISGTNPLDMPLAKEIQKPESAEKARKIIVEVIESQRQLKKDSKSAEYLLDCCAKAQSALTAAVKDGLRPESKLAGVAKQLDQIQAQAEKIRIYLDEHAKH
ncbi:hypothetical protein HUT24_28040 [Pseudomonas protegens]|uniref:hypothetical protein n=5 Tax=Pseudomonas protegens TaxID=380021 RepID=UPI001B311EB5|nr:hypothetical protein [Pseudomonas protegens]QTU04866.1 hypothetical protein HUT25_03570 [Pseudomonas protegens]QTU11176.1 hypothetical protein HUT23_04260 [Pseudomonas protegens]QTU41446.1 hypothetical protein HUT24_28040 [Pseudomonas protegens]